MRVAHLLNNYEWVGGIETYVLNLVPQLHSCGIEQAVVCNRVGDVAPPQATIINNSKKQRETTFELTQFKPDLVHVHNIFDLKLLDHIINKYPVVFTTHGFQLICPAQDFYLEKPRDICQAIAGPKCLTTSLRHRCLSLRPNHAIRTYRFSQWALKNKKKIAHLISPCRYAANRHIQAGFNEGQVSTVPYFCELEPLDQPRKNPLQPTITFLGRITAYKGADIFLKILAGLPSEVRGLLIGNLNDKNRAWLKQLSRSLGVQDRLELRPWIPRSEIRKVFEETSVFIFPSIWPETLGIVGLESLSCGVPVVAFDIGGAREWCFDGETGFRAERKNSEQAISHVQKILGDGDLSMRMGRNGIKLVRDKFSIEVHLKALTDIYSGVTQ